MHWILALTHEPYSKATSLSNIATHLTGDTSSDDDRHKLEDYYNLDGLDHSSSHVRRANASFVILARNSNLDGTVRSVREIEDRFNQYHGYPYVFLNEEPFTDEFKKYVWAIRNRGCATPLISSFPWLHRRVSVLTDSKMEFGVIPHDHWFQPDWIDESKASAERKQMESEGVIYGGNAFFFFGGPLASFFSLCLMVASKVLYRT